MRINLKTILGICIVALLLILNIGHIDLFFQEYLNSNFISRLMTIFTFDVENASGRGAFYQEGIRMFMEHPGFRKVYIVDG